MSKSLLTPTSLFCFAVLLAGGIYTALALKLEFVTERGQPGAGMIPVFTGILLMLVTTFAIVRLAISSRSARQAPAQTVPAQIDPAERSDTGDHDTERDAGQVGIQRTSPRTAIIASLLILGYVILLPIIGIWLSTLLYLLAATLHLNSSGRVKAFVATVTAPLVILLVFANWLNLQLPAGSLFS